MLRLPAAQKIQSAGKALEVYPVIAQVPAKEPVVPAVRILSAGRRE